MIELGQVAYEAYRQMVNGKSAVTGNVLPEWPELPPEIREAWRGTADAVRMFLETIGAEQ